MEMKLDNYNKKKPHSAKMNYFGFQPMGKSEKDEQG